MAQIPTAADRTAECMASFLIQAPVVQPGRKRKSVADRCSVWRLGGRNRDARQSGSNRLEEIVEVIAERLCADRNSEGDEHDQHGIFGSCSAALVMTKATGQSEH